MTRIQKRILGTLWATTGVGVVAMGVLVWLMRSNQLSAAPMQQLLPDPAQPTASASGLPVLFTAPDFALQDQNNTTFEHAQLRGKVWVADFIFTTCKSLCPLMTQQMSQFQKMTEGTPIQMVSFSVDPETDTPAVLKAYARANGSDESRWHFLTGTKVQTWQVSKGMKLAVGDDVGGMVMHSSHFLLVDGAGKIRGVYDYKDVGFLKKLVTDARALQAENPVQ